eukprot:CAMPEP_0181051120 /NCGR_PEP_ID=MMETSP1070-20121207/16882_1 /TAXON_ID=265543 /ORGANISM="Minutocellus polymorphus, Strain NH13" /LENGTH=188 /DNA_ID=CAMNT_0023130115 /DNA_START=639 /DNA_END=1202 /DNA_ORIENTATION=+
MANDEMWHDGENEMLGGGQRPSTGFSDPLQDSLGDDDSIGDAKSRAGRLGIELDLSPSPAANGTGEGVDDGRSRLIVDIVGVETSLLEAALNLVGAAKVSLNNGVSDRATKSRIFHLTSKTSGLGCLGIDFGLVDKTATLLTVFLITTHAVLDCQLGATGDLLHGLSRGLATLGHSHDGHYDRLDHER